MTSIKIVFIITALVTLFSAFQVVTARRIMHAALWLVITLLGVAGIFVTLQAGFFAVVQVLVYVGAIAILLIFAVMLTRNVMEDVGPQVHRNWWWIGLITAGLFFIISLTLSTWSGFSTTVRAVGENGEDLAAFGKALVDPAGYMIPFEVASLVLLAALIGAVYVAADKKGGKE